MINDLPTIFEVVSGTAKKQSKDKSSMSNHSSTKSKSNSKVYLCDRWKFCLFLFVFGLNTVVLHILHKKLIAMKCAQEHFLALIFYNWTYSLYRVGQSSPH